MGEQSYNKKTEKMQLNWTSFFMSSGFLFALIIACIIGKESTYRIIGNCFNFIAGIFGGVLQVSMVVFWVVTMVIALSKWGNVRIGGRDSKRTVSSLSWYAILIMTMTAAGGVFWAGAEPFVHFQSLPQHFSGITSGTQEAVQYGMAQSFMHWGFLVWGGSAFCVPLMLYAKEVKNLPLRPSSMLYPLLGEKGVRGAPGKIFDGLALIAVAAGTVGPTGFISLQLSFVLHDLWGVPDTLTTQMIVIMVLMVAFLLCACTGLKKGIDYLAKFGVVLTVLLGVGILIFGTGTTAVDYFVGGYGIYIRDFFSMAFSRTSVEWSSIWTVFFEAWFLGFGPSFAVLTITLSKGRSLREVLVGLAIVCPIIANIWFAILGTPATMLELAEPGSISKIYQLYGIPSLVFTMLHHIPLSFIWIPITLVLCVQHVISTGAGVAYSMSTQTTNMDVPPVWVRAMFCILLATVAALLVWIGGDNAMNSLQSFMVIGGIPMLFFYIALVPSLCRVSKALYQSRWHRINPDDDFIDEAPVGSADKGATLASGDSV